MNPRKLAGLIAIITFTIALIAGGIWWWSRDRNPYPADIRQSVNTPLFFPKELPAGFTLNRESFAQKRGVVIFSFNAPDGNKLNFSLQKSPAGYNFDELYNSTMKDTKNITTPLGIAHIGNLGENTMANLVIDGTWVMAIYSQPGANDDIMRVMKSLKRY